MNIFEVSLSEISPQLDPIGSAKEQSILFLQKRFGISEERAGLIYDKKVASKGFKDPLVYYYQKDLRTMDKAEATMKLSTYISSIPSQQLTLVPSFTCYTKVDYEGKPWRSTHSKWTTVNKEKRNDYKTQAKEAFANKDITLGNIKNTTQVSMKVKNNALSGTYALLHLPLSSASAHYSLTSVTRSVTSTANTIVDSLLSGTKLFFKASDVYQYITAIITYTDFDKVKLAMDTLSLKYPTVDEVMNMIKYNSYYYWRNNDIMSNVEKYLNKLNPLELSAVLYTYDLFHLLIHNEEVVGRLLVNCARKRTGISDDISLLKTAEEYELNILHHVLMDELRGKGLDYNKFAGTPLADLMVSTLLYIRQNLEPFIPLIKGFLQSPVLPINMQSTRDAIRRGVVLSDTDSTVFTFYQILKRLFGDVILNTEKVAVSAILATFVSETIINALAQLVKNMNIDDVYNRIINMKSEYFMSFLIPTTKAKHYIDLARVKEMLILEGNDAKFHGVGLINGKVNKKYNLLKQEIANAIIDTVEKGIKLDPVELVAKVIDTENKISELIHMANTEVLKLEDIKESSAYSQDDGVSKYFYAVLWNEVLADKYGEAPVAPYRALKLPVKLGTSKRLRTYIERIDDQDIKNRFIALFKKYPKSSGLKQILLPADIVVSNGIPEILRPVIDEEKIILEQLSAIYDLLALLGIPLLEKTLLRDSYVVS